MDRLELMEQFVRIAEARSLSRAARSLSCSEPTLSKRLRHLEESLGAKLLERGTRGVRLTEGGERYFEACKRLLSELREVEADLADLRGSLRGSLRVYLPVTLGEEHLTSVAVEFQRRYPELKLELMLQDGWIDLVTTGADLAIRVGAVLDPAVVARSLGGYRYVLAASPAYLQRAGVPGDVDALASHEYLRLGGGEEEPLATPEGPRLVRVQGAISLNNGLAVKTAMLAGAGIGRLARWLVERELAEGKLVEVLPGIAPAPVPVCATFLPSRFPLEKIRSFIRFVSSSLAKLPGWMTPGQLTPILGAPASSFALAEEVLQRGLADGFSAGLHSGHRSGDRDAPGRH